MQKLTDEEKLKIIDKKVDELVMINELFGDALKYNEEEMSVSKFIAVFNIFDRYLWQIRGLYGYCGDDFDINKYWY